jgi:4-amino-4-deoxy-L-arabinose transferase-like glycosyltransferase
MTQPVTVRLARWGLPAILALYLVLGLLYAVYTPAWQAPDEPAHYNYVRFLAEQHRFPVLKLGDYPAAYLEAIKAARFPASMPIDPIRYEFHQPPLYYLLAVPFFWIGGGALLPLRLLSVAIGALLLLVICWTVRELAPNRPGLALGTTVLVAFLPMHLAMTAAANNDSLAELLLAISLLLLVRYLKGASVTCDPNTQGPADPGAARRSARRLLFLLGVTTGLGFLTKTSDYIVPLLVLAALAMRDLWLEQDPPPWHGTLVSALCYLLPALALGMPWWLRNMAQYGFSDPLGLGRHAEVVVGQLRTADFVAQHGVARLVHDFLLTSFHSFWGQFGWMGVLLDPRLYQALAILSGLALTGFVLWLARAWSRRAEIRPWQWAAGGLLALSGTLTLATYIWYNTGFLQHQGRYLFPALLPIGLVVALGWREALRREQAALLAALAVLVAVVLNVAERLTAWVLAWLMVPVILLIVGRYLPARWYRLMQLVPYVLLVSLDLACLFLFIVPQLTAS